MLTATIRLSWGITGDRYGRSTMTTNLVMKTSAPRKICRLYNASLNTPVDQVTFTMNGTFPG